MEHIFSEHNNHIKLSKLIGPLDILGVGSIETKFSACCAGDHQRVMVDLSQTTFLASIGVRLFTINAKSLASRNGRMVLLSPTPEVRAVLEVTGIPSIIPVYDSKESAEIDLLAR